MKFKTDEMIDSIIDSDTHGLKYKKWIVEEIAMIARGYNEKGLKPIIDMQFRHALNHINEYLMYLGDTEDISKNKTVSSPSHYTSSKIEVIDVITELGLSFDFCLGNAIKYIMRAGLKDKSTLKEDIKKAKWYISRAQKEYDGVLNAN